MAIEIERKFLVNQTELPPLENGIAIRQAYVPTANGSTVRVRLADDRAILAIKSPSVNMARQEFEYEIPVVDAMEMLGSICDKNQVEKTRYLHDYQGMTWEIDIFHGANDGLIVAEVELERIDQEVELPHWVRAEVTGDRRYSNFNLAKSPFTGWLS